MQALFRSNVPVSSPSPSSIYWPLHLIFSVSLYSLINQGSFSPSPSFLIYICTLFSPLLLAPSHSLSIFGLSDRLPFSLNTPEREEFIFCSCPPPWNDEHFCCIVCMFGEESRIKKKTLRGRRGEKNSDSQAVIPTTTLIGPVYLLSFLILISLLVLISLSSSNYTFAWRAHTQVSRCHFSSWQLWCSVFNRARFEQWDWDEWVWLHLMSH